MSQTAAQADCEEMVESGAVRRLSFRVESSLDGVLTEQTTTVTARGDDRWVTHTCDRCQQHLDRSELFCPRCDHHLPTHGSQAAGSNEVFWKDPV